MIVSSVLGDVALRALALSVPVARAVFGVRAPLGPLGAGGLTAGGLLSAGGPLSARGEDPIGREDSTGRQGNREREGLPSLSTRCLVGPQEMLRISVRKGRSHFRAPMSLPKRCVFQAPARDLRESVIGEDCTYWAAPSRGASSLSLARVLHARDSLERVGVADCVGLAASSPGSSSPSRVRVLRETRAAGNDANAGAESPGRSKGRLKICEQNRPAILGAPMRVQVERERGGASPSLSPCLPVKIPLCLIVPPTSGVSGVRALSPTSGLRALSPMRGGSGVRGREITRAFVPVSRQSPKTILEGEAVEVDEKTEVESEELQVRQRLRHVNGGERLDRLELDEEPLFDDQVGLIGRSDHHVSIEHRDRNLAAKAKPAVAELFGKAQLVHRLDEPRANLAMNLDQRTDHRFGQVPVSMLRVGGHGASSAGSRDWLSRIVRRAAA